MGQESWRLLASSSHSRQFGTYRPSITRPWIASATCASVTRSMPSRSAMVRATCDGT